MSSISTPRARDLSTGGKPHFRLSRPATLSVATVDDSVTLEPCPVVALGRGAVLKRAFDVSVAFTLLILCGAPMLLVALLVKLTSPGPVMYRQQRVGLGGRRFLLFKFRTMRADAEAATGPVWASEHDPRRTAIGSFLRRWSIDELPQLFNVLRGDMSLVGPRPERPYFVEKFSRQLPSYMLRHGVLPGLTGWAQLNGLRGNTSINLRLDFDLYYIRHWSLLFDAFILILTPFKMLTDKNAY